MRRTLITLLAVAGLTAFASAAKAATVTLYLTTVNATTTSGTWQLYIADSQDNDGIANYDFDIVGAGGAVVNSSPTRKSPAPTDISNQYADGNSTQMGFNTQVNGGSNSGTGRVGITGSQNTLYGSSDDPTFDMGILVGVGQEAAPASARTVRRDRQMAAEAQLASQLTPPRLGVTRLLGPSLMVALAQVARSSSRTTLVERSSNRERTPSLPGIRMAS